MVNGIELALEQTGGNAGEFTINYESLDYSTAQAGAWTPEATSSNARKAAQDDNAAVYIGEFNAGGVGRCRCRSSTLATLMKVARPRRCPCRVSALRATSGHGGTSHVPEVALHLARDGGHGERGEGRAPCRVVTIDRLQQPMAATCSRSSSGSGPPEKRARGAAPGGDSGDERLAIGHARAGGLRRPGGATTSLPLG